MSNPNASARDSRGDISRTSAAPAPAISPATIDIVMRITRNDLIPTMSRLENTITVMTARQKLMMTTRP